jgi:hypothetical protein
MLSQQAIDIFKKYGVDVTGMPLDQIRKSRNALLQKHHPDTGGTMEAAQDINAAFDLLKNKNPYLLKPTLQPKPQPQPIPNEWIWAGYSGEYTPNSAISRSDFTDINFIKKSMWELSGKTNEEWTIFGYDGILFTNTIKVYGSSKIFYYMTIAMVDFQTKGSIPLSCRAVFVRQGTSHDLYLIYENGKHHDQNPIKFVLHSRDLDHINHTKFMQELPGLLAELNQTTNERGLVRSA